MAIFVHLTAEKNVKSILRNGISRLRTHRAGMAGIFAMPMEGVSAVTEAMRYPSSSEA